MSIATMRRASAPLTLAAACLLLSLSAAPASANTIYACAKKHGGALRLVSRSTKCKRAEYKVSWNTSGPAGRNGLRGAEGKRGANGANGTNGTNGANGAVAAYFASAPNSVSVPSAAGVTLGQKQLPAGAYAITADVALEGSGETPTPGALIECFLSDSASELFSTNGNWVTGFGFETSSGHFMQQGQVSLQLAITTTSTSTVQLDCEMESTVGKNVVVDASNASILAVQASKLS
ncbi:MAG TPA: collagen-like protein [Solirubrobacteraceae bacterium]|jgi:hypothetical protein|nr:collagen-like protein [Solirubrobacteraceae bacterium]